MLVMAARRRSIRSTVTLVLRAISSSTATRVGASSGGAGLSGIVLTIRAPLTGTGIAHSELHLPISIAGVSLCSSPL